MTSTWVGAFAASARPPRVLCRQYQRLDIEDQLRVAVDVERALRQRGALAGANSGSGRSTRSSPPSAAIDAERRDAHRHARRSVPRRAAASCLSCA